MTGAALSIYSVHFAYPGSADAIVMREPATDAPLGERPEWIAGERNEPAAFVRGSRPTVAVVFAAASGAAQLDATIGASGENSGIGIKPRQVSLRFDAKGLSAPVLFELAAPLPDQIGTSHLKWAWFIRVPSGDVPLGTTEHVVYTTWKAPLGAAKWALPVYGTYPKPSPPVPVKNWTYAPLVAWTCEWAAGADSPKEICDAIIRNASRSGLHYYVSAWDVRTMLLQGGGMCGGWYKMFQGLAAAQGVPGAPPLVFGGLAGAGAQGVDVVRDCCGGGGDQPQGAGGGRECLPRREPRLPGVRADRGSHAAAVPVLGGAGRDPRRPLHQLPRGRGPLVSI